MSISNVYYHLTDSVKMLLQARDIEPKLTKMDGNGGFDLYADIPEPITIDMLDRALIPTGVYFAPEALIHADVRATSGLRNKYGVYTSLGLIDNIYRGNIGAILHNISRVPFTINPGDKIGQLVFWREVEVNPVEVAKHDLPATVRGELGFGGQSGVR